MFKQFNRSLKTMDASQLLRSQYILYILSLVSLLEVIYFASTKDANALFILLIVGFLTSFFSKNMIVILFTALLITHLLRCDIRKPYREGAENMGDSNDVKTDEPVAEKPSALDELPSSVKETANAAKAATVSNSMDKSAASAEKKKELYDTLKKDFVEFQSIQQNILDAMKEIDPLLNRAETFITKFESMGKQLKK
jgi:hypothetical protein